MNLRPNIPAFKLPSVLALVGAQLPQWPHSLAFVAALNTGIHMELFPEDSLKSLENRTFLVEVLDSGGRAQFTFRQGFFQPLFGACATHDLVFRANLSAFLQLLTRQEDPDTLFFNRSLMVEGDTELGLTVKNMLDAIEWPELSSWLRQFLTVARNKGAHSSS